jgi:hypothetical protein
MRARPGALRTADEIVSAIGEPDAAESAFHVLVHLASTGRDVVLEGGRSDPRGARLRGSRRLGRTSYDFLKRSSKA